MLWGVQDREANRKRLETLATARGLDEVELLRLVLHHAVTAVAGLGGVAHLGRRTDGELRLAAISGLPLDAARVWERMAPDDPHPPARAVREQRAVWTPENLVAGDTLAGDGMEAPQDAEAAGGPPVPKVPACPGACGALSVPMALPAGGVLSIFVSGPLDDEQQEFLWQVAKVASETMEHARVSSSGVLPWWLGSGSRLREAMAELRVGTWEWDVVTGELLFDDAAMEVVRTSAGVTPEIWDSRVETWLQRVHPDDAQGVLSAIDHALNTATVLSVEYRVVSPDGRVGWVELRGHTTYGQDGTPLRMTGTGWDTTTTRVTEQAVTRILRNMPDAFLVVLPGDWRVIYANAQASLLGAEPGQLVGQALWETHVGLHHLQRHFEQAVRETRPISVDVQLGDTWQRLRLLFVDPHLVVQVSDVTAEVEAENAAAERARRITALTEALASALTTSDVVDTVGVQILPPFAASGALVHATVGSNKLHLVGQVGYEAAAIEPLRQLDHNTLLPQMRPRFFSSQEAVAEQVPALAEHTAGDSRHAWALLPLMAENECVGSLLLAFDEPQTFPPENKSLLIVLTALVAQALGRARLYDAEHRRAHQLQRALLPSQLPSAPAVATAARYRPASDPAEVGGDWYDAIPLSGGRVALVIGDVMGHGVREAITMSRMRTAVSTLTTLDHPPEEMLAYLNDVAFEVGGEHYVTCIYAIYDPTTGMCGLASAGHPPPALLLPDGRTSFLDVPSGPPLGAAQLPYQAAEICIPEGSVLVFYTDGLIGGLNSDPDTATRQLADAIKGYARHAATVGMNEVELVEGMSEALTQELPGAREAADDAAVLIARTRRFPEQNLVVHDLPYDPASAGLARKLVAEHLTSWGLERLIMSTELIVSELVGNVVRHSEGPIGLRLLKSNILTCEVSDGNETTPRRRHAAVTDEEGRGLQLVAAMCDRWGTRYIPGGKTIWTEQSLEASLDLA
ncbi:SpoIIE family protein phosphatase [Streptomyces oryzae]|uniref:SpoIIE family protein phosphatase n=1 Tax=Streptomyces oryzae TaxID=1434886 RepID=A0ABS3XAS7_9ACTN|nr:SpoIIE family protein phosphatase [Streptomyces oryzae]MBO8192464.1 SpoIIE family protein phosphatase [Streptomyces oryzae]